MNLHEQTVKNPLAGLPSFLAIRDFRRRLARAGAGPTNQDRALRLLRLDPPALVRAIRAAAAPVYGENLKAWRIDELGAALGPSLTRRALEVPPVDVTGTSLLRKLWLHAIATAKAAQALAASTSLLHPEEAYVAGLLHDLPLWLAYIGRRLDGQPPPGSAREWMLHWGLPQRLVDLIEQARQMQAAGAQARPAPDCPASLLCAAELLAELADFAHPEADESERDLLLESIDRSEFLAAQKLRREVEHELREIGLDLALPEPDLDLERGELQDEPEAETNRPRAETSEVVLSVLGCSRSPSYRGIITATMAAALRYLGFDRAFHVKWIRSGARMAVRAKADLSPRRIGTVLVTPTADEAELFGKALQGEQPVRIAATRNGQQGLLRLISADEVLAVPISREFQTPSFLVLDRSLSTRPIQMLRESDAASTLAITAWMLTENLLLKLRRQRAQKFALTDPLTRLFNRRMGITCLDQEIARAQRSEHPTAVLMIDLDDFKKLNDVHGHVQGDHALRATAEVLRKTLRRSDTICRYGGEEFLVVLPETTAEESSILAARLFTAVEARGRDLQLPITVSIGQASIRPHDTVESLLQRADKALYASKSQGRNRFSVDADSD